jgi:amino acid permease
MGCVEGVTCSETCVSCAFDGTEEVSIKVEEAIDIKNEIPEAIIFPSIQTEHEVRLFVC